MQHRVSVRDRSFRRSFEAFEIDPEAFDHAAHLRLAYVYLCESAVDEAADRTKAALLAYLDHLGIGGAKYHETLTQAWVRAVAHFMAITPARESAADFIACHPRLLDSKIMLTHYSAEVLFSSEARASFVDPDIQAIPAHRDQARN